MDVLLKLDLVNSLKDAGYVLAGAWLMRNFDSIASARMDADALVTFDAPGWAAAALRDPGDVAATRRE